MVSIFGGKKGGVVPALWNTVIDEWLTPSVVDINIDWDDKNLAMSSIGEAKMTPLTDADGNQTHMFNSVSQVAIGIKKLNLMSVVTPTIVDPDLRTWTAKDGVNFDFTWSG